MRTFNKPMLPLENPPIKIVNFNLFSSKSRSSSKNHEKDAFRSLSMERLKLYNEIIDKSSTPIEKPAIFSPFSMQSPKSKPIGQYSESDKLKISQTSQKPKENPAKVLEIDLSSSKNDFIRLSGVLTKEKSLQRSNSFNKAPKEEVNYNSILSNMRNKARNSPKEPIFLKKTSQTPTLRSSYTRNEPKMNNFFKEKENIPPTPIEITKSLQLDTFKSTNSIKKSSIIVHNSDDNNDNKSSNPKKADFQEYKRLQEKLLFLETRIVEMKNHFETAQKTCSNENKPLLEKEGKSSKPPKSRLETPKAFTKPCSPSQNPKKNDISLQSFVTQVEKGHFLPKELEKEDIALNKLHKMVIFDKKPKQPLSESIKQNHNLSKKHVYYIPTIMKAFLQPENEDLLLKISREHFLQTFQSILFAQNLKTISQAQIDEKKVVLTKKDIYKNKKTIIFDLDETLIHCNENSSIKSDIILPIRFPNGQTIEAGINVRPYTLQCLRELSSFFEIIVFTASHNCYANVVLNYLDPNNEYIQHRLYREHCIQTEEGIFIKDLRVLNRNLDDMLIVDNAAYSFGFQLNNGVPILPFYDNREDRELVNLINYLKGAQRECKGGSLREWNRRTFRFEEFGRFADPEEALKNLYE